MYYHNLLGTKVRHKNMPHNIILEFKKVHGNIATCVLPKSEWTYVSGTLIDVIVTNVSNLYTL